MGSWHYTYCFPAPRDAIQAADGIEAFGKYGLEPLETVRMAEIVDDLGHVDYVGAQIALTRPRLESTKKLLEQGEQFLFECHDRDILLCCAFAANSQWPHVALSLSKKQLDQMGETGQRKYIEMLARFASLSRVGYVILALDPPDYFEERFLSLDDSAILDRSLPSGHTFDIEAVWVREGLPIPHGVLSAASRDIGCGYSEHRVI